MQTSKDRVMRESFTVRDIPISERPRERLLNLGAEALSAQEILALVLGSGVKDESVMVTAQRLISAFGSLKDIADASIEELTALNGIGPAKATQLKAAFELGRRVHAEYTGAIKGRAIKTPDDAVKSIGVQLRGKKKEHFWVILLDTRNQVIRRSEISVGSLDSSIVHPREVFKEAISASASSVLFVHNHPSGDPQPSREDMELTKRLVEAGSLIGIEVLDHIIISDREYLSMNGSGLM